MSDKIVKRWQAPAAANYYNNIGCGVYDSDVSAKEVTVSTAGTNKLIGVIEDAENATAGWVDVCIAGVTKGRAGAAISETMTYLTTGNDGRLDPASAGNYTVGRAILTADAADGDWIQVLVQPGQLNA